MVVGISSNNSKKQLWSHEVNDDEDDEDDEDDDDDFDGVDARMFWSSRFHYFRNGQIMNYSNKVEHRISRLRVFFSLNHAKLPLIDWWKCTSRIPIALRHFTYTDALHRKRIFVAFIGLSNVEHRSDVTHRLFSYWTESNTLLNSASRVQKRRRVKDNCKPRKALHYISKTSFYNSCEFYF